MAKLGKILETQFKKLGIEINEEIKPLIELDTDVSDDIASKIDKGLLTLDAAKNNPDITKALKQATLAGADAKIDDIIKEMGITVDEDFATNKNTYDKIGLLAKAAFGTGKIKGEGNGKEGVSEVLKKEREEFAAKEADYNQKLKAITDTLTAKETEFTTTRENDLTSFELQKILIGKDYVFPKEMDSSIKVQTALGAINKDLLTTGNVIKRNEAGNLVITKADGTKAYDAKFVEISDPNAYIDGILSHNKLLNINDPNAQQQQQQGASGAAAFVPANGAQGNQQIAAEIDAQLKSMA